MKWNTLNSVDDTSNDRDCKVKEKYQINDSTRPLLEARQKTKREKHNGTPDEEVPHEGRYPADSIP